MDFCTPSTCQNGGTCFEGLGTATTCTCLNGFTGSNCQTDLPNCIPNPCLNGGTCFEGTGPSFSCSCSSDFTGQTCEIPVRCQSNSQCDDSSFCRISCPSDDYPTHTSLLSETALLTGVSFISVHQSRIPQLTGDISVFAVFRQEPGNQGYVFFYGTTPESRNLGIFLDASTDPASRTTPGIYLYYTSRQGNMVRAIRVPTNTVADNRTHSLVITIATTTTPGSARFFLDGVQLGTTRALVAPDLSINVSQTCFHVCIPRLLS